MLAKVEESGRIALPKEIQSALCLRTNDTFIANICGGSIVLSRPNVGCAFCKSAEKPRY